MAAERLVPAALATVGVAIVPGGVVPSRGFHAGADWANAVPVEMTLEDGTRLGAGACLGRDGNSVEFIYGSGGSVIVSTAGRILADGYRPPGPSEREAEVASTAALATFGLLHAERARNLSRFRFSDQPTNGGPDQLWEARLRRDGSLEITLSNPPPFDEANPLEARLRMYSTHEGWITGTAAVMRRDDDGRTSLVGSQEPGAASMRMRVHSVSKRLVPQVELLIGQRMRELRRSASICRAIERGLSLPEVSLLLRDAAKARRSVPAIDFERAREQDAMARQARLRAEHGNRRQRDETGQLALGF